MRDPWEFWFDIHCILPMNYEKLGGNFEAINSAQVIYLFESNFQNTIFKILFSKYAKKLKKSENTA